MLCRMFPQECFFVWYSEAFGVCVFPAWVPIGVHMIA